MLFTHHLSKKLNSIEQLIQTGSLQSLNEAMNQIDFMSLDEDYVALLQNKGVKYRAKQLKAQCYFMQGWLYLDSNQSKARKCLKQAKKLSYQPARWALDALDAKAFDESRYIFPDIKINDAYLNDPRYKNINDKQINLLLADIKSIDNLRSLVADLQKEDTAFR